VKVHDVWEKTVMANNNRLPSVPSCAHEDLFIGVVTHGHYNIRNAPVYLP
jgi:hypothetical protein